MADPRMDALFGRVGRRGGVPGAGGQERLQNYQGLQGVLATLFPSQAARRIPHMTLEERIRGQGNGMGAGFLRTGLPGTMMDPATGRMTRLAPGAVPVSAINALSDQQRSLLTSSGVMPTPPAAGQTGFIQLLLNALRNPSGVPPVAGMYRNAGESARSPLASGANMAAFVPSVPRGIPNVGPGDPALNTAYPTGLLYPPGPAGISSVDPGRGGIGRY